MVYNQIEDLALLLKSISHPIRLKILCLLQDRELSVSEIRDSVETSGGGERPGAAVDSGWGTRNTTPQYGHCISWPTSDSSAWSKCRWGQRN